jgi:hypothetical protein
MRQDNEKTAQLEFDYCGLLNFSCFLACIWMQPDFCGPHSGSSKVIKTHYFRDDQFLSQLPELLLRLSRLPAKSNLFGQAILGKNLLRGTSLSSGYLSPR